MNIFNIIKQHRYQSLLFFLAVIFFSKLFINPGAMLLPGDILGSAYFPKFLFSSYVLHYQQIPLWNSYMFSGMPFLADPSSSMFYPLNLLFLVMPTGFAFGYLFILDILLIGIFTYLFAKALSLNNFSSFVSAITFMFSGTVMYRIYAGHLYILDAIAWLPLLLLAVEHLLKRRRIIFGIIGSVPIALMVFAGHSQFTFYNLLFVTGYFLLRLFFVHKEYKNMFLIFRLSFYFLLSLLIGLGLSAIQLLPSLELSSLAQRSGGISFEFAKAFSLHPYQLLSFILPYFFGSPFTGTFWGKGNFWETCAYLGIVPLIFSGVAIFYNRDKYVLIFLLSLILGLLLSFGSYTPLYQFLFKHLPFFDLFRAPARFLYIYAFSVSVLAGFGVNFILTYKFNKAQLNRLKRTSLLIISVVILFFLSAVYFSSSKNLPLYEKFILRNSFAVGINHLTLFNQFIADLLRLSVFIISFFAFFYLFLAKKITNNLFKAGVVLIIIADLWIFSQGVVDLSKTNEQSYIPKVIDNILQDNSTYRIFAQSGTYSNISIVSGQQILTGYNGQYLKNYRNFLWLTGKHENTPYESFIQVSSIDNPVVLNLLNTKYVVWDKKIQVKNFRFVNEYNENNIKSYLYENLSFFPRAYVLSEQLIKSGKFLISKGNINIPTLKDKNELKFLKIEKSDISKGVKSIKYAANELTVNLNLDKPGYLVLSEVWYPGWKAYDNGTQRDILKGDYIFRTVYLRKGKHNVKFVFEPLTYKIGMLISLVTLTLVSLSLFPILKPKFSYKRKPKPLRLL